MAQIVQGPPTFAERLGTGLGSGLQQLSSLYLDKLLKQQQQQQLQTGLKALLPNLPEEQYGALSQLPMEALQPLIKSELARPGEEAYAQALGLAPKKDSTQAEGMSSELPQARAPRLSEKQATEIAKLKAKEQQVISSQSTPYFNEIEKEGKIGRRLTGFAEDALKILKTGKAKTGLRGYITPAFLQTQEGQELETALKNIVLLRAQIGKGVPSRMRLILEEGAKAQIWQQPKVIEKILNDILEEPDTLMDIAKDTARSELMEQWGEHVPKNFRSEIEKKAKSLTKQQKKEKSAKFTKESLPNPKSYSEGAKAKNPVTGEYQYILRNGQWEEL